MQYIIYYSYYLVIFYASTQCNAAGGIMVLSCSSLRASVRVCVPKHC